MAGFVDLLKLIVDADTKGAVSAFKKLENDAGSSLQGVERQASSSLQGVEKQASSSLAGVEGKASGFGSRLSGGFAALSSSMISTLGPAAIAGGVGAGIGIAINAASDLNEMVSKTKAVFGDSADGILQWSDTAATSLGISKTAALDSVSSFGNLFLQLGMTGQAATDMSTKMVGLATDFASFFHSDPAAALEAISAAFRGEYDSVQKFVPTINAAAVEQEALKEGLAKTTGELTQQDKAVATYNLLLKGAGSAAGDFAKTSGSLAGQQKILKAQLSDTAAEIGNSLIPAMLEIVKAARTGIDWLERLGTTVQDLDKASGKGEGGLLGKLTGNKGFDSKSWSEFFGSADKAKEKSVIVAGAFNDIGASAAGIGASVGPAGTSVGELGRHFERAAPPVDAFFKSAESLGRVAGPAATSVGDLGRQTGSAVTSMDTAGGSADSLANAVAREGSEFADTAKRTQEANDALATNINLVLQAAGGALAVSAAQREFNKAVEDNAKVQTDSKATTDEKAAALDRETSAALGAAQATVDYAQKQEEAQGKTLSAKAANDILIDTLFALSSKASPEVQAALGGIITKLQGVGEEHPNPTVSVNDQASTPLERVQGQVDGLDGARATIHVGVDVNDSGANAKLTALRNRLNAASASGAIPGGPYFFKRGGMVPGAIGTPVSAVVHGGEYVLPANLVAAIAQGKPPPSGPGSLPVGMSGSSSGSAVVINFNGLVTDEFAVGREIKRVLAKSSYSGVS